MPGSGPRAAGSERATGIFLYFQFFNFQVLNQVEAMPAPTVGVCVVWNLLPVPIVDGGGGVWHGQCSGDILLFESEANYALLKTMFTTIGGWRVEVKAFH